MIHQVTSHIPALDAMRKYPSSLYYKGSLDLLERPKVSMVGTRKPSRYSWDMTYRLANALAKRGVCVVSGAAMGIDAVAHQGAGAENTIAVAANGLDIRYPAANKALIQQIENQGLLLSQFDAGTKAAKWSFVIRNELVVALGDILVVAEADPESGSMRSVAYAEKMGKEIFVLPQRLEESRGTNQLLAEKRAGAIYDIEQFVSRFGTEAESSIPKDAFYYLCQSAPTLDLVLERFGDRVYEAELEGLVTIHNGIVRVV